MTDESEKSYLSCRIIKVDDVQYRADFDLHDRFQGFSAELLRLSLGGLEDKNAACKLRIKAEKDESGRNTKYQWSERFLYLSGAALAGAAVFLGLSFAILLGSAKPNATHIQEAKAGGRVGLEWESFSSGTQTLDR